MPLPVTLDRNSPEPLYRQVERQVRAAVDTGRLRPGDRVASVRELARELDVGRLTVATAYEQLAADGYLVGRVGFGTIVAPTAPAAPRTAADGTATDGAARPAFADRRPGAAPPMPIRPAPNASKPPPRIDLRPGPPSGADMAVGPALERLLREAWRDLAARAPAADPDGDPLLRATIAAHVRATRAGRCEPDDVVVLSGALIGIAAVARLWLNDAASVAIEDPPDPAFRRALDLPTTRLVPVAIDAHGLRLDRLPAAATLVLAGARVQAVTGARMPLARRLGLLAWASGAGALVVEDARADDLALSGSAGPSLQGLDDDGRVIHIGAFSALLHPGVQLGYAVVPPALAAPFRAAVAALDAGATPVEQRALGRFLADGHLDRHLARVRRSLAERFDATVTALRGDLGWLVSADVPPGGTRLVVTIEDETLTAARAAAAAARAGIAVEPLRESRLRPTGADRELLIDVGRADARTLVEAVGQLARALADERRRARDDTTRRVLAPAAAPIPRRWPAITRTADQRATSPVRVSLTRAARDG